MYFDREMQPILKTLNKLYNFPSWAMNPKHANTDRNLILAKVQKYLVDIGNFVVTKFPSNRHAEAWEYVAEKAQSKLRGPVLWRLYSDIVARDGASESTNRSTSKDIAEKRALPTAKSVSEKSIV